MQTQYFKDVSENGVLPHTSTVRIIYVFGQSDTNQRHIPQKKFALKKKNNGSAVSNMNKITH